MTEKTFRAAYNARDFDATVRFFDSVLGLECIRSWDRPSGKGALYSAGGNAVIEFLGAATGETPFEAPPPDSFSLMIEVESADRTLEDIVARGGVVARPIVDKPWNHRTFSVRDPNGVEIFFFEVTSAG